MLAIDHRQLPCLRYVPSYDDLSGIMVAAKAGEVKLSVRIRAEEADGGREFRSPDNLSVDFSERRQKSAYRRKVPPRCRWKF